MNILEDDIIDLYMDGVAGTTGGVECGGMNNSLPLSYTVLHSHNFKPDDVQICYHPPPTITQYRIGG